MVVDVVWKMVAREKDFVEGLRGEAVFVPDHLFAPENRNGRSKMEVV